MAISRTRWLGRPGAALLAMSLSFGTAARAADNPAAAVPGNAVIYVAIPDFTAAREAFHRTAAGQMIDDPTVKDALKPYIGTARKLQELVARRLGLDSPSDLEQLPQGGLAAFLTLAPPSSGGADPDVQLGLYADFGENAPAAQRVVEAIVRQCVENGARREAVDGPGGELTHVTYQSPESADETSTNGEDRPSPFADEVVGILTAEELGLDEMTRMMVRETLAGLHPPEEFAVALNGSRLILGTSADVVRQCLRLLRDGPDNSFATSAGMRMLERRFPEPSHFHFIIDVPRVIEVVNPLDVDTAKFIKALGLDALGPAVFVQQMAPQPGMDSLAHGFWEIRDASRGLGRMLMAANQRTTPPPMLEADTIMYGVVHADIPAIVDEVIEVVGRFDPADAEEMRAGMKPAMPDGSVLDIRQDVIAHMRGPLFGYLRAMAPFGPGDCNALFGLNIDARSAVEKLLAQVPPGMFNSREVRGGMVYEFPMVPVFGVAAGLSDRTWMFGTLGAIEGHLRAEGRESSPLAEDPHVQRLLRQMPEQACAVMFVDSRRMYEAQTAIARSGGGLQPQSFGSQAGAWIQWWMRQNFIGDKLPDPQMLAKYQGLQMFTLTTESDGLRMEAAAVTVGTTN